MKATDDLLHAVKRSGKNTLRHELAKAREVSLPESELSARRLG